MKLNYNPSGKSWKVSLVGAILLVILVLLCLTMSGCSIEDSTAPTAIDYSALDWGTYECADEIKADLSMSTVTITPKDYGTATSYSAFNMIHAQVDDFVFTPGVTTVAEVMEHFIYDESVYSMYTDAAGMEKTDFNPDRLMNDSFNMILYKHNVPYVVFSCKVYSFLNYDIIPAEEFIVTGFSAARIEDYTTKSAYTQFADVDGYNKMAKERCWISSGIRLDGDGINYDNIDLILTEQGLVKDAMDYNENYYYNSTNGTYVTYTSVLCCGHVFETTNKAYLTNYSIVYTVSAETQECIRVEIKFESAGMSYNFESTNIRVG